MLKHPGNHLGDSWYFVESSIVHCYYLTCPDSVERHTAWDIAHATSRDLVNWELQGIVVSRGADDEWDGSCIATGSVIQFQDRYWMAYTGRWNEPRVSVGLAVSDDLFTWTKVDYNPITTTDTRYYEPLGSGSRRMGHWRDPYLFQHEQYVYHFVCASRNDGDPQARGSVGVARSIDMIRWEILPPPEIEPVSQELECPQVRKIGDCYFLLFSAFPDIFAPESRRQFGDKLRHGSYVLVGDGPFGPFTFRQPEPIVPVDHPVQPYACQYVEFKGMHYLMGTVWNDQQDFLTDAIPLVVTGDKLQVTLKS